MARGTMLKWVAAAVGLALSCPLRAQQAAPAVAAVSTVSADAAAWPARVAPEGHSGAKGVVRDLDVATLFGVRPMQGVRKPTAQDRADAAALLGDEQAAKAVFEGPGAFIFRAVTLPPTLTLDAPKPAPAGGEPKGHAPVAPAPTPKAAPAEPSYFVFVSAEADPGDAPRLQRTWFGLYTPAADHPRGLALLMPGMLNTPEPVIERFARDLRSEGWFVLRMMCQPSRFTETVVFDIDPGAPAASMERIAGELSDRVAECAYASRAAADHVLAAHPELKTLPRIAVGMSGGAIILPTVVALEPASYAAAVLIAGGADFFRISDESNYKYLINAVDFRWLPSGADPTEEQRAAADRLYLEDARLDGYHTAAALKGKPILMIHGDLDHAVPAVLGDLLWKRLGEPERWVERAGHEEIFFALPKEMDRIMAWIAAHANEHPDEHAR